MTEKDTGTGQPPASLDPIPPSNPQEGEDTLPMTDNHPSSDRQASDASHKEETEGKEEWEYVTGAKLALAIAAVTIAAFLMLLDNSIVATAIPRITSDFNSLDDIGWYGSAYLLASCSLQPLAGKLYNQFSSKYTFIAFVVVFELGSLLCGLATSSNMLIIGRAVAGLGGAGIQNGALTIIAACVPLHKRAIYLGFMMPFGQIGILLGPLIGGVFTEYTTWRWCFYINLPLGGIALIFIMFLQIPDRRVKHTNKITAHFLFESLDIVGFSIFAPAAIQFLLALEWGGTKYSWNSATVIGLFCGSAGTLAVFLFWEHKRGDTAMIPLKMLKQQVVWSSCLTIFFTFANMLTLTYYLAIYFQAVKDDSPTMSGVSILPTVLSQMMFALISGVLVGRIGYYIPFSAFSGGMAAISAGLLSTLTPTSAIATWVGYQLIGGVGRGSGVQMPIVAIQNTVKAEQVSVAMSLVVFSQTFGGALFLSFDQTTFSNSFRTALQKYAPEVNAEAVINAGATGFRGLVDKSSVAGVILAYNKAVSHVFYIATGVAVGAFIFCWGMGWKSVKKPKVVSPEA